MTLRTLGAAALTATALLTTVQPAAATHPAWCSADVTTDLTAPSRAVVTVSSEVYADHDGREPDVVCEVTVDPQAPYLATWHTTAYAFRAAGTAVVLPHVSSVTTGERGVVTVCTTNASYRDGISFEVRWCAERPYQLVVFGS